MTAEWASGDHSKVVKWETGTADGPGVSEGLAYHRFFREDQQEFAESGEIASWGDWYLSTSNSTGMTWQIGQDSVVRDQFASKASLANTKETNFRPVNDKWYSSPTLTTTPKPRLSADGRCQARFCLLPRSWGRKV